MNDPAELIDRMADHLEATGQLSDPAWRQALHAVPRHLFVPPVAWTQPSDEAGRRIDADADPDGWWDAAYADQPIVTHGWTGGSPSVTGSASPSPPKARRSGWTRRTGRYGDNGPFRFPFGGRAVRARLGGTCAPAGSAAAC